MIYILVLLATMTAPHSGQVLLSYELKFNNKDACLQHLTAFQGHESEMLDMLIQQGAFPSDSKFKDARLECSEDKSGDPA